MGELPPKEADRVEQEQRMWYVQFLRGFVPFLPLQKTTEQYLLTWVVFLVDLGSDGGLWGERKGTYHPKKLTA